jgi:hypothetical protein
LSVTCNRSVVFSGHCIKNTDHHDITEILLKVALNTITSPLPHPYLIVHVEHGLSEWLLFNAKWANFQLDYGKNKLYFDQDVYQPVQHAELVFLVLAHWNNSPQVVMSLQSDKLFWFRANQFLLLLLSAVC